MKQRMYGLWESPISGASLSAGLRLSEPCFDTDGRTLAWVEGRSDRGVIVVQRAGEAPRDLTSEISVRALVGYGGGDFTIAEGVVYFVGQHDQRIYRQPLAEGVARPITPGFGQCSTPRVSPDGRWVMYIHSYEGEDVVAVVDTAGERWPTILARGRDFYAQPAWGGDGARVAWVEWDFPNMPWDGTELRLSELAIEPGANPRVSMSNVVAGGTDVSVLQPVFGPDGALIFVSDATGWGQVYRLRPGESEADCISDGTGEYAQPAWSYVRRVVAPLPDGRVAAVRSQDGFERVVVLDRGETAGVAGFAEYSAVADIVSSPAGGRLLAVASSGTVPPRVVSAPVPDGGGFVHRYSTTEAVPAAALSHPRSVSWRTGDGEEAHGLYFPPASDRFTAEGPAPLVVLVHGGPTSQAVAGWNAQVQYLATRGYGVLVPNYRGSTGYGRAYMLKLRGNWGIHDVEDARSGAAHLVAEGLADAARLVIMGGSAGGYTVLQSLIVHPGYYRAGLCLFGVSNMFTLASDTHKFEARYLDHLLGPLPEAAAVYRERSPIFHADRIVDPVAVFQGDVDRVVPRAQSDTIVGSLRARGVTHEYHVYEGEGHGWRKAETIDAFYGHLDAFLRQHVVFA